MKRGFGQAKLSVIATWYVAKFSRDIYLPALPAIALSFDIHQDVMQFVVAIYFTSLALSRFVWSPLTDIFGRRKIMLITIPIFLTGSLICAFSVDFPMFFAGRLLQGFGIGCVTAIGRAMINDMYDKKDTTKALTYLSLLAAWSPALATMIGGYILLFLDWHYSFVFLFIMGLILLLQTIFYLPETNPSLNKATNVIPNIMRTYKQLISDRDYCRYLLAYSFVFAGTVVYYTASPFLFVKSMKIDPHVYGYFAFMTVAGIMVGKFIATFLVHHFRIDRVLFIGILVALAAGLVMTSIALAFEPTILNTMGPTMLYFVGMGIMSPTSKAATMSLIPGTAGAASALFGLLQGLASTMAGVIVAPFHDLTALPMGLMLIGVSGMGLILFIILRKSPSQAS